MHRNKIRRDQREEKKYRKSRRKDTKEERNQNRKDDREGRNPKRRKIYLKSQEDRKGIQREEKEK